MERGGSTRRVTPPSRSPLNLSPADMLDIVNLQPSGVPSTSVSGFWGGYIQMVKSSLGMGLLFFPYAFSIVGWAIGTIGTFLVSLIVTYSIWLLVATDDELSLRAPRKMTTFTSLAYDTGVPQLLIVSAILMSQIGVCTGYVTYIANNVHHMLPDLSQKAAVLLTGATVLPLMFVKQFSTLVTSSAVGLVGMVVAIGALAVHCSSKDADPTNDMSMAAFKPDGLFRFLGIALFAAEGIINVPTIRSSLRHSVKVEQTMTIVILSAVTTSTVFVVVGLLGWSCFGNQTASILSANLPTTSGGNVIRIALCIHLWASFPLQVVPLAETLFTLLNPVASANKLADLLASSTSWTPMLSIKVVCALVSIALSLFVTGIGSIMSMMGWLAFGLLSFVAPVWMFIKVMGPANLRGSHLFALHVFMWAGGIFSAVGFVMTILEADTDTSDKDLIKLL